MIQRKGLLCQVINSTIFPGDRTNNDFDKYNARELAFVEALTKHLQSRIYIQKVLHHQPSDLTVPTPHVAAKAPVLIRTLKLSSSEHGWVMGSEGGTHNLKKVVPR